MQNSTRVSKFLERRSVNTKIKFSIPKQFFEKTRNFALTFSYIVFSYKIGLILWFFPFIKGEIFKPCLFLVFFKNMLFLKSLVENKWYKIAHYIWSILGEIHQLWWRYNLDCLCTIRIVGTQVLFKNKYFFFLHLIGVDKYILHSM